MHTRYIVVGAGPGGLQIGHYLDSAHRDYIILEKGAVPGSFFTQLPRFRQLISINKLNSGRDELDHVMRHDWNSLLSDSSHSSAAKTSTKAAVSSTDAQLTLSAAQASGWLLFRNYSSAYYPSADSLVTYLRDWSLGPNATNKPWASDRAIADRPPHPQSPLRVRFNTTVTQIDILEQNKTSRDRLRPRFRLTLSDRSNMTCTFLIMATGLQAYNVPSGVNVPAAIAQGWIQLYHNASTNVDAYAGRRVLILGRGNGAFEFANSLLEVAASVHLVGRSSARLRLAYETHYPGDIRAIHSHLLETYQLKSQDVILETPLEHLRYSWNASTGRVIVEDVYAPPSLDSFGRPRMHGFFRAEYNAVIAATGWHFSTDIFTLRSTPKLHANGKHPALHRGGYESVNVPGLFFAGTLMHGHDYKKSSGGFIHGFRYLIRALHRQLEEEELKDATVAGGSLSVDPTAIVGDDAHVAPPMPWPRRSMPCGLRALVSAFMRRINLAAGLFQMFGGLADVLLLQPVVGSDVAGFINVGTLAALYEPWSFPPPSPQCASVDEFTAMWSPKPAIQTVPVVSETREASDAALERALQGDFFEEVPTGAVASRVASWTKMYTGAADRPVEWITLTLEFGSRAAAERAQFDRDRDPFSLSRANADLRDAESSLFLHPVLRYWTLHPPRATRTKGRTPVQEAKPVQLDELHILEDPHGFWDVHEAHVLPLARWLQDIGARRSAAALGLPMQPSVEAGKKQSATPNKHPPLRSLLMDWLMGDSASTLHYRGASVGGGSSGWFLALSTIAADSLCATHAESCTEPDIFAVHFSPPSSRKTPLTHAEIAFTAALRKQLTLAAEAASTRKQSTALNASLAPCMVPESPETTYATSNGRMMQGHALHTTYSSLTEKLPGLPIIVFDTPRAGIGALRADVFGLKNSLSEGLFVVAGEHSPAADVLRASKGTFNAAGGVALQLQDGDSLAAIWHATVARNALDVES